MWIGHRTEIQKLAFPALALRRSKTIRFDEGLTLKTSAFGSEKYITNGLGRWSPAWSWTKDYTAQDQATPAWAQSQSAVLAPGMSELCFKQAGKTAHMEGEMLLYRIDILAISECRWTDNSCVTTSLGNTIVCSGKNDGDHRQGVAILMSKAVKKSMLEWTPISERLMVAIFKSRH